MASGILKVKILGDASNLHKSLGDTESRLGKFGKVLTGALVVGGAAAAGGLAAVAKAGIGFNSSIEQTTVSLKTMLGSQQKANDLIADMTKFAAQTPFEFPELADATKKLVAFGFEGKDIIPTMTKLGDLAAALNIPIGELSELYGKAKVQGRLYMEDINQLTGRGIPVIQEFAKQFGVSEEEVRGLVETGKIGFPELEKAIDSLTGAGGKFGGLMAEQSKTLAGQWSTLKDTFNQFAGVVTKPIFDYLVNTALPAAIGLMERLKKAFEDADSPVRNFFEKVGEYGGTLMTIFNPLGAILVEAVKMLYDWAKENKDELYGFFERFTPLLDTMQSVFETVWPAVQEAVQLFIDFFTGPTGQKIIVGLIEAIGEVLGLMRDVFADIWPVVQGIVKGFIDWFNSDQGQAVITLLLDGISTVMGAVRDVFTAAWPIIESVVQGFITWFNSADGQAVIKTLIDAVATAMSTVRTVWEAAWPAIKLALEIAKPIIILTLDAITTAVNAIASAIRIVLQLFENLEKKKPSGTSIPGLQGLPTGKNVPAAANGALVRSPQLTMVGDDGPEVILPLTRPQRMVELLQQAGLVGRSTSSTVNNNQRQVTINVSGNDGITIGRQIATILGGI